MKSDVHKLDNPVWHSLNEVHTDFSIEFNGGKFFKPKFCSFGGFTNFEDFSKSLNEYANQVDNFYVVGEISEFSNNLKLKNQLTCNQMVLKEPIAFDINEKIVELKSVIQKNELFNLVNLVQPGYFHQKTSDLGKYYGIYKDNKLIAVTGERMKMNAFTEVSAVVTHPEHTRKGYAKQLIKHTCNQIIAEGKTPYLHVAESNIGAILLYEKLGFKTRKKISFWNFEKK